MADISRWAQEAGNVDSPRVDRLLSLLDDLYSNGDFYVRNLITVSFIEMLDEGSPLLKRFGPILADTEVVAKLNG